MNFNAKNLSYDSNQPTFIRRLRGEIGGQDSSRHERAIARPRKLKNSNDDEDDEPTYVNEENREVISKSEFEALANRETSEKTELDGVALSHDQPEGDIRLPIVLKPEGLAPKEHVASVGGSSKRKVAKVFGNEDIGFAKRAKADSPDNKNKTKTRKGKKIKLSFDEDAGS